MSDRNKMIDVLGEFTVFKEHGRNYLYFRTERIAECINGDYKERFGSIEGWIERIEKRERKRVNKISETIENLNDERKYREDIISACYLCF